MAKQNAHTSRRPAAPKEGKESISSIAKATLSKAKHRPGNLPYSVNAQKELAPLKTRSDFGFSQEEFGRLVGMSTRKISSLETSKQNPSTEDFRRVNELSRLHAELSQIIEASAIPTWMKTPNEYFGGLSPMEVVQRGESDRIYRMAWRLQEGIPLD